MIMCSKVQQFIFYITFAVTLVSTHCENVEGRKSKTNLHPFLLNDNENLNRYEIHKGEIYRAEILKPTGEIHGIFNWINSDGSPHTLSYATNNQGHNIPQLQQMGYQMPNIQYTIPWFNQLLPYTTTTQQKSQDLELPKIFKLPEELENRQIPSNDFEVISSVDEEDEEGDIFIEDLIPDTTTEKPTTSAPDDNKLQLPQEIQQVINASKGRPVAVSNPSATASAGFGGLADVSPGSSALVGPGGIAISFPHAQASVGPQGVSISRPVSISQAGPGGVAIAAGQSTAVAGIVPQDIKKNDTTNFSPTTSDVAVYPIIANYFFGFPLPSPIQDNKPTQGRRRRVHSSKDQNENVKARSSANPEPNEAINMSDSKWPLFNAFTYEDFKNQS